MEKKSIEEKLKEFFISSSEFTDNRKNFFLYKRKLINKKTNKEIIVNPFCITDKFFKDYVFYKTFCEYLYDIASKKGLEPYFLTLTQSYSLEDKNCYESISYLREHIKIYRKAFRELIREFQRENDILFISVIEFNENLFFHLHAIIFIHPLLKNKFLQILENKIQLFSLGNNKKFKRISTKNKKDYKKTYNYLLKSLKKASKNTEYAHLLSGTINILKYRLVTHSKTKINKKMYFKLYPHINNKFNNTENKFLNIYKYMIDKSEIKIVEKMPSKKNIKKILKSLKKHTKKIYIFKKQKKIEKDDEYVELQNDLLIKKILNLCTLKDSSEILKKIERYIDEYISSLENSFSYKILMHFRWRFNTIKNLIDKGVSEFLIALKNILLYRIIKYIYTTRTVIYIKKKKSWQLVYDSGDFAWEIEQE